MKPEQFFVSVIIPVYNGEAFLAEAIQTVQNQGYYPLEIIVVDDGSTDKTAEVADKFKEDIHYTYQPNMGPSAARNMGLRMAKGNVIALLDVDDLWPDNKLELQINFLIDNPSVEIVNGQVQFMQLLNYAKDKSSYKPIYEPHAAFNLGSAIFRKSVFDKAGFFDDSLRYGEDVDWLMRAWEINVSMVVLEQVTLFYRKHHHNMTFGKNAYDLNFIKAFKKSLDRRRKQSDCLATPLPKLFEVYEFKDNLLTRRE